ncbi:GntR family transcriptional regulator [soil metagenome]
MAITQIVKTSLVASAISQLRKGIEDGSLPPGKHLNQEDLAAAAGISRTPIRQALITIAHEGLLEESTQGFRVVQLDVMEAIDMFEVRAALEGVVARLAAKRATPEGLARLRRVAENGPLFTDSADDPEDFHFVTADIVGLPVLTRLRTIAHSGAQLARSELLSHSAKRSHSFEEDSSAIRQEHCTMLNAIVAGEQDEAERLVRSHFLEGRDRLVNALADEIKVAS